jgi:hypothetical protein
VGEALRDPARPLAAVGTAATLLVVALAGLIPLPEGAPAPRIPATGQVVLARGEVAVTEWVEVAAGQQARWQWDAHAFFNFEVSARDIGLLDGGDTGAASGCVRAEAPFALRLVLEHTAWPSTADPAHVDYSIVVEPADPFHCENVTTVHSTRGAQLLGAPFDDTPPDFAAVWRFIVPAVAGNLAYFGMLGALARAQRTGRLKTDAQGP